MEALALRPKVHLACRPFVVLKGGSRFSGAWTPFLRVVNRGKDCLFTSFVGKDKCCCSCLAGQMGKAMYAGS